MHPAYPANPDQRLQHLADLHAMPNSGGIDSPVTPKGVAAFTRARRGQNRAELADVSRAGYRLACAVTQLMIFSVRSGVSACAPS
jgi:hypothetical protein